MIKRPADTDEFIHLLKGQTIHQMGRRGKFILFYLDDFTLVSHLRMEGKYGVFPKEEPTDKHTHVIFTFTDGLELRYRDVRKFGTMHLFPIGEEMEHLPLRQLGPEPFSEAFSVHYFTNALAKTSRNIKTVLLDQTIVSGLGNIYVDESLYQAQIHPERLANTLSQAEVKRLHKAIIETLAKAVEKGGTTIRSYVNSQGQIGMFQLELSAYGQEDKPCKHCGTMIKKLKLVAVAHIFARNVRGYQNHKFMKSVCFIYYQFINVMARTLDKLLSYDRIGNRKKELFYGNLYNYFTCTCGKYG